MVLITSEGELESVETTTGDVVSVEMTVVDTGKVEVWVWAGQSVTLAAQDVTV